MSAAKRRRAVKIVVGGLVKTLNQIACLLEFDRKEESCRNVYPLVGDAALVAAAGSNFPGPKIKSALVRCPIQKVEILLLHEEVRLVYRVTGRRVTETTRVGVNVVGYFIDRELTEGQIVRHLLRPHHDGIAT